MSEIRIQPYAKAERFVRSNTIEAGEIVMDLDRKEVFCGNKIILMTVREFFILEYLLRARSRIVPRAEMLFLIWGDASCKKEGRLSAYINSIRKKIEHGPFSRHIYTVTGKGYLFIS